MQARGVPSSPRRALGAVDDHLWTTVAPAVAAQHYGMPVELIAPGRARRLVVVGLVLLTATACTTVEEPTSEPTAAHAGFDPASTVGTLAPGLPAVVAQPAPGAEVLASSVREDGALVVVSVNLRTPDGPEDVAAYYDELLSGSGFDASGDPTQRVYARTTGEGTSEQTDESVVLMTVEDDGSTLVSLSGRLVPDDDTLG
ncbi:hypothetical protein SAMN04489860_1571 [Paraoerskovia marina]|uniref:Uncharacterized protein n=1 Tax=Paraoerskovia marina TaxID=545619 RepID=A0A1H1S9J0_9CELL|nr:hypothetical protein SAMN04489860_1571 [Paraoerskovia marina]